MNDCDWNPKESLNDALDRRHQAAGSGGQPRLLDQVRNVIRCKHYSIRTEQSYIDWIRRYIYFHGKRHPAELDEAHISAFLTDLAVRGKVAEEGGRPTIVKQIKSPVSNPFLLTFPLHAEPHN